MLLALLVLAAIFGRQAAPKERRRGDEPARVVDGDTVVVGEERFRLWGIDAPESDQPLGAEATAYLSRGLGAGYKVRRMGECKHGRTLGIFYGTEGRSLNASLVRQGLAWRFMDGGRYVEQEKAARREGKGVHAGGHVSPWEWRQRASTGSRGTARRG